MRLSPFSNRFFVGLCLAFASHGALAKPSTSPVLDEAWHLKPASVAARTPFDLAVVKNTYGSCQTEFTHTSLTVDSANHELIASFVATAHPERVCIQNVSPYGPTFAVPALASGKYQVKVTVLPECYFPTTPNGPICLMAVMPSVAAESLTVVDSTHLAGNGWFLGTQTVPRNTDFTLKLLNEDEKICDHLYTHTSVTMDANQIHLRFTIDSSDAMDCITMVGPAGPTFAIKGLAAGDYPVLMSTIPACAYSSSPCPFAAPIDTWVATLHVTAGTAILTKPGMRSRLQTSKSWPLNVLNVLGRFAKIPRE